MKAYIFDIETIPLPADQLPPFDESQVLTGNLKDPAKVAAKVEAAKADWLASAALSALTGSVAMVGFKEIRSLPTINVAESGLPEDVLVETALQTCAAIVEGGGLLVGFNCHSFDLPFLYQRAWRHGLRVPRCLRRGRYWADSVIDLRMEWLLGERQPAKGTSSLATLAKFMGLPEKLGSGADFAQLTQEQRIAYLTRDLEGTEALYLRMFA